MIADRLHHGKHVLLKPNDGPILSLGHPLLAPGLVVGFGEVVVLRERGGYFSQAFDAEMFLAALGDGLSDLVSHLYVSFSRIQFLAQQLVL